MGATLEKQQGTMSRPVDALFEPFTINGLHLPNRIVMPSMGHGKAPGGVLGPEFAEFFRLRAEGGVGLLMGEASTVPHVVAPGRHDTTHFHGLHSLASYRRIVETVHRAGGRIMAQLHHKGGTRWAPDAPNPYLPSVSPSGLFLPPTEDVMREVVHIGVPMIRLSQWKTTDYTARLAETPAELEALLCPIADAGIDLIDCSQRRFWQAEFPGSDMNFAGWAKKVTGKPTMTVGSVGLDGEFYHFHTSALTLKEVGRAGDDAKTDAAAAVSEKGLGRLIEMLERGDFDLVGVGRGMIANPTWPQLVREGRMAELKPYGPASLLESTTFAEYEDTGGLSAMSEQGA